MSLRIFLKNQNLKLLTIPVITPELPKTLYYYFRNLDQGCQTFETDNFEINYITKNVTEFLNIFILIILWHIAL